MLVQQRGTPHTRKHPDPIVPGDRPSLSDPSPSPTSPLERNPLSPKGWKNRDSGAVGLGIVADLEKAATRLVVGAPSLHVSPPIAIASRRAARPSGWPEDSVAGCPSPAFQTADFLSHCNLCRKRLHGKDIYMYRGEKAFCSMECRYRQIVSDEFQEKCGSEASKQSEMSSSPYSGGGRLFFTGIVAA